MPRLSACFSPGLSAFDRLRRVSNTATNRSRTNRVELTEAARVGLPNRVGIVQVVEVTIEAYELAQYSWKLALLLRYLRLREDLVESLPKSVIPRILDRWMRTTYFSVTLNPFISCARFVPVEDWRTVPTNG